MIIIMQRLHQDDPTGHLLARNVDGIRHICLPGECEGAFVSPDELRGRYVDGLLDPDRLGAKVLESLKTALGSYGYAGQILQSPQPRQGAMFQREWFEVVEAAPAEGEVIRGWDLAASKDKGHWTAGCRMRRTPRKMIYIEHVTRLRGSPLDVEHALLNSATQDGKSVKISIPQDPGQAPKSQIQAFAAVLEGYNARFSLESGSKETRAESLSAQAEAGNVKIVRGPWNDAFLDEICIFPNGTFDDQVDAASRAYAELTKKKRRRAPPVAAILVDGGGR
jgi:predicted phage terminase large subunit-like protein